MKYQMARPRVGGHAWIRNSAIPKISLVYRDVNPDDVWDVYQLARDGYNRTVVYMQREGRQIALYRGQVKAAAFCYACEKEGHMTSRCPAILREARIAKRLAARGEFVDRVATDVISADNSAA